MRSPRSLPQAVRIGATLCLFLLSAAPGPAQEAPAKRSIAIFDFVNLSGDDSYDSLGSTIADQLSVELGSLGYSRISAQSVRKASASWKAQAALAPETFLPAGAKLKADVAIVGFFSADSERIVIGCRAYDVGSGRLSVATLQAGDAGIAVFDTIDLLVIKIAVRVRERLNTALPAETVIVKETVKVETTTVETGEEIGEPIRIVLNAPYPGAKAYRGSAAPLDDSTEAFDLLYGSFKDGILEVNAKKGVPMALTIRAPGYYDRTLYITPESDGETVILSGLFRSRTWDLGASAVSHFLLGAQVGARWFFIPDWCWAGASFGAGVTPLEFPPRENSPVLTQIKYSLVVGSYVIQAPDYPFRLAFGLGAMGELFFTSGVPLVNIMLCSQLRFELNYPDGAWFLQANFGEKTEMGFYTNNSLRTPSMYMEVGYLWKL